MSLVAENPSRARPSAAPLTDSLGRRVSYLRLSLTDRCDFRCTYCMPERVKFVARRETLTLDEFTHLALAFIARGVRKIRLTGGEPLLRPEALALTERLSGEIAAGRLDEITLTTNASQLAGQAAALHAAGMRRINISLDSRKPEVFARITRGGSLAKVMAGIAAAQQAGLNIKINMVVLRGVNDSEVTEMLRWTHGQNMDLTLIENMPMSDTGHPRGGDYMPLTVIREQLEQSFTLRDTALNTGGPARYVRVGETGGRLGFITPLTNNFCAGCNRVRVSCTGRLYMCLGHNDNADLRAALRDDAARDDASGALLSRLLDSALARKAEGHDFMIAANGRMRGPGRHMSVTGG